MPNLIKEKEVKTLSHDRPEKKTPVVFIRSDDTAEKIDSNSFEALLEGLSHLDVKVSHDPDEESSIAIFLSEDVELLEDAWKRGIVPVTFNFDNRIEDYNPNTEKGNSFVYENFNQWEIFAALVRALETYKFPYDWRFIKRSCVKSV